MIKVLVVDDSRTEQIMLSHMLTSESDIEVIGSVDDGLSAIKFLEHTKPDVIAMDLNMPGIDGLQTTRTIMETVPIPIIIVTADKSLVTAASAYKLVEAGAVGVVEKPHIIDDLEHEERAHQLRRLVRNMSQVKLVHRWPKQKFESQPDPKIAKNALPSKETSRSKVLVKAQPHIDSRQDNGSPAKTVSCIAIGASTGGPPVIKYLLKHLPETLPVPIFIVQHIASGFCQGFAFWLKQELKHDLHIPANRERVRPGHIYLAPSNYDMGVDKYNRIILVDKDPKNFGLQSVSFLFKSIAEHYGSSAIAMLLTGMGSDGAKELKQLRDLGAITIAQDEKTSVIHGMPGVAIKLEAAQHVMNPEQMSEFVRQIHW